MRSMPRTYSRSLRSAAVDGRSLGAARSLESCSATRASRSSMVDSSSRPPPSSPQRSQAKPAGSSRAASSAHCAIWQMRSLCTRGRWPRGPGPADGEPRGAARPAEPACWKGPASVVGTPGPPASGRSADRRPGGAPRPQAVSSSGGAPQRGDAVPRHAARLGSRGTREGAASLRPTSASPGPRDAITSGAGAKPKCSTAPARMPTSCSAVEKRGVVRRAEVSWQGLQVGAPSSSPPNPSHKDPTLICPLRAEPQLLGVPAGLAPGLPPPDSPTSARPTLAGAPKFGLSGRQRASPPAQRSSAGAAALAPAGARSSSAARRSLSSPGPGECNRS
mmetsp:Transcript_48545/g.150270  ORF Transcript_48545/g.150270 Transcript_48545/m.150270 type:complete len:334 (-) Transcript_48545:124-1125(-)